MTEPALGPLSVVENLDVVKESAAQPCSIHVEQRPMDPTRLALERGPEGLHGSVVVALTG